MTSNESLATFVSVLKDNRILDGNDLTQLTELQSRIQEPELLATELLQRGSLTRFQTDQIFQGDAKKLVLGQYILMDALGEGGMGMVYKARHTRMKRIVALKIIRKDMAAGSTALQRFNQEIEAAAALHHPNVVTAFDANEVDDTLFFVMEYVEGIDLGKLVHKFGKVSVSHACDYILQAAQGLQHAHERGMVHRDIKPSNLLLAYKDGVVKILDMGLARLRQSNDNRQLTFTGMVMGTPDFISPEQAKNSHMADIRSDIYSLGCTLYYLIAGKVPFGEGSFTEKLLAHTLEKAPDIAVVSPGIAPEIVAIYQRLMEKKPDDRYQTPGELAEALKPFAEHATTAERYRPAKDDSDKNYTVPPSQPGALGRGSISQTDQTLQRVLPTGATPPGQSSGGTQPLPASPASKSTGDESRWPTILPAGLQPVKLDLKDENTATGMLPAPARSKAGSSARGLIAICAGIGLALVAAVAWKYGLAPRAQPTEVAVNATHTDTQPTMKETKVEPPPTKDTKSKDLDYKRHMTAAEAAMMGKRYDDAIKAYNEALKIMPNDAVASKGVADAEAAKTVPVVMPPPPVGVIATIPKRDPKAKLDPMRATISADGRWMTAGFNEVLRVWDLDNRSPDAAPVRRLTDYPIYSVALKPDGQILIGTVHEIVEPGKVPKALPAVGLWEPNDAEGVHSLTGHEKEVSAVTFSYQGNRALSGSEDRTVRLWELRGEKEVHIMRGHEGRVLSVAMSHDGRYALSGGRDNKVIYWNLETGKAIHTFTGHDNFVTAVAFSPDDKYALTAGYDKKVILWDLQTKQRVRTFASHDDVVWSVAFSPDGKRFLSGGGDQRVLLWSVDAVEYLRDFPEHKSAVIAVAFSADGKYGLSVSTDHTARRWALPLPK